MFPLWIAILLSAVVAGVVLGVWLVRRKGEPDDTVRMANGRPVVASGEIAAEPDPSWDAANEPPLDDTAAPSGVSDDQSGPDIRPMAGGAGTDRFPQRVSVTAGERGQTVENEPSPQGPERRLKPETSDGLPDTPESEQKGVSDDQANVNAECVSCDVSMDGEGPSGETAAVPHHLPSEDPSAFQTRGVDCEVAETADGHDQEHDSTQGDIPTPDPTYPSVFTPVCEDTNVSVESERSDDRDNAAKMILRSPPQVSVSESAHASANEKAIVDSSSGTQVSEEEHLPLDRPSGCSLTDHQADHSREVELGVDESASNADAADLAATANGEKRSSAKTATTKNSSSSEEPLTSTENIKSGEIGLATNSDSAETEERPTRQEPPTKAGEHDVLTKRRKTKGKRRPPKYRPSIRTAEATLRWPRNARPDAPVSSGARSLTMSVRVVFGRRSQCRVSLLPPRSEDLTEEIEVVGPEGRELWSACQDEWYGDIFPDRMGALLEHGAEWESQRDDNQLRWVLTRREIYVLAPCSTISSYVSASRLTLFEDHVVLCTKKQEEAVRTALADAGCSEPVSVPNSKGLPSGWTLFREVRPTIAVHHDDSAGIYNVLRPVHNVEIILQGGIRLSHSTWLKGHPPTIRVRGVSTDEAEVTIDGNLASDDGTGRFVAPGWDSPGLHTVFCGGVSQSYDLTGGAEEWKRFPAFCYRSHCQRERFFTVCGPLVYVSEENEDVTLAPYADTCLLGAFPGQIAFSAHPYEIRTPEYLAVADFPIVWSLPSNPLRCDKSAGRVRLLHVDAVVDGRGLPVGRDKQSILQWCNAILNASRRRLRVEPDTDDTKRLWEQYRRAARHLWKRLR